MTEPGSSAVREALRIGIAADHGGFELKEHLLAGLLEAGYPVEDFGDRRPQPDDDYPDFIIPLARAVADTSPMGPTAL